MKNFEPIAIIGQGCVLPGCFTPDALWQMVVGNKVNIRSAVAGDWRVDMNTVIAASGETDLKNKAWNDRGGYIVDFDEVFDASAYALDVGLVEGLDPVFKWSFYSALEALRNSGYARHDAGERTGLIMGNLSYPTRSFSKFFEERQLERLFPEWKNSGKPVDAVNRFMSGLPAILTAKAIGIKGEAYAIDAACASSLYALKLACDRLHSGADDMMLVGGVCAADQLFLHVGFTALNALSASGQSRPFNKDANGLIPAEGAGFIVIKRLRDAEASGDNILGVVRGIGLSNDGKQGGFLSPSQTGQVESMKRALESAGLRRSDVSYVECHATGTAGGDSVEVKSMREVYGVNSKMHLSSLKGNVGHAITVSGIASIIKVLGAFQHKILPPSPNAFPLNDTLCSGGFTVAREAASWKCNDNRVAGISNFGFGGNNAHVILEEWNPKTKYSAIKTSSPKSKVAIVGVELQTDRFDSAKTYLKCLLDNSSLLYRNDSIAFDLKNLSSPPNDLKVTLSQQLLILQTTQRLLAQGIKLNTDSTGVFIGMGADCEINRYGFRKRLKELLQKDGLSLENYDISAIEEEISPVLTAAGVLGTMPNIPANRINNHFDFCGPGFTVSCEELSGTKALEVAVNAIQNGELRTAIVGAVDMSDEFVNRKALSDIIDINLPSTNAAVVLVVKNYDDAVADGDVIYASVGGERRCEAAYFLPKEWILSKSGYSHASSGLLEVATAALFSRYRLRVTGHNTEVMPLLENAGGFSYQVSCNSLFGGKDSFELYSEPVNNVKVRTVDSLSIHCFSGESKAALIKAIKENAYSQEGVHRLGIVSNSEDLAKNRELALQLLQSQGVSSGWLTPFIHYRFEKIDGDVAFVFTGAASAYPQMGKDLVQEFPGLLDGLKGYCKNPGFAGDWIFDKNNPKAKLPFYQLAGSSLMCQVHAEFTKKVLGLKPHAAIGLSSGETNSMFALDVWEDMDGLLRDINESELYHSALGVDFKSVKDHWGLAEDETVEWENWRILAPVSEIRGLLSKEERVYLTIVNTANDCVIGGDKDACARILQAAGVEKAMPLHHDIAVHCAPVIPFEKKWRALHTRPVKAVSGVRFYSNYLDGVYVPTSESVADALTGQALHTIDFTKIIEKAYSDGVRVFIEHGPRNSLSLAINEILKGKEFIAVALDRFGLSSLSEALKVSVELWCAGVSVDLSTLLAKPQQSSDDAMKLIFPLKGSEITIKHKGNTTLNISSEPTIEANHGQVLERAPQIAVTKRSARHGQATEPVMQAVGERLPQNINSGETMLTVPGHEQHMSNPNLNLFLEQYSLITEVHESFLSTQLQAQEEFTSFMRKMMNEIVARGNASTIGVSDSEEMMHLPPLFYNEVLETILPAAVNSNVKVEIERVPSGKDVKLAVDLTLPGPKYSRPQLEILASGRISSVFGPLFEKQDEYEVQVRMPEPPLLLCDRVTGIKGEPATLGLGTIWTETDVTDTSWYLHNNRMPPGIFIEAGQADLLLISYLGIDFQNKGERAYRLLGCELKFFGELPKPGDTLKYEIHVDGYAKSGETTLFFFHYDCHINGKLRISVRNGQAGFFTKAELEESKGVIWDPATAKYGVEKVCNLENATRKSSFTLEEVEAYTLGDMVSCFGKELSWTQTHTRTPRSQSGYQNFIKHVTVFDLEGGPAQNGYLKAETIVSTDDWYFDGHFKNDPCMPGTLMADACLQMMAFYMVGAGLTTTRDGWRFEPVTEENYKFICRGQVTPDSKKVTYEIFVDEIIEGDYPTLFAHVLTTVDGTKAFLCERLGLRLVPDWPLTTMPDLLVKDVVDKPIALYDGFKFGYDSLINCALGRPMNAFGPKFQHYDNGLRSPRLPGPPYHFMTRIAEYNVVPGQYKGNPFVISEYDIPKDVWYFNENGSAIMPYAVLMEVALQPCGWLSTFVCQDEIKGKDLLFRNLDGTAIQHRVVVPADKTIVTKAVLTGVSIMDDVIIVKFDVVSSSNGDPVFAMKTVFGFFDSAAMRTQKGLAISDGEAHNLALEPNLSTDLITFPVRYFSNSTARLPSSKLLMIDRVVALYPEGGQYEKGYIRAEKDVEPNEWFFKAHFFQDPVQPGSLGVEAMLQLIQFYMLEQGLDMKFENPYFEPVAISDDVEWHYRGQVTPDKMLITVDFDVSDIVKGDGVIAVYGEARLWVDGLKIYHSPRIGMRIVNGAIA